jgi:hypothetical protein
MKTGKSEWLKKYGLIPKTILVVLFFIGIGGLNIVNSILAPDNVIEFELEPYHQGSLPQKQYFSGSKQFAAWLEKKETIGPILAQIYAEADAHGGNYTLYEYMQHYEQLMDLENEYRISLTSGYNSPLHDLRLKNINSEHQAREIYTHRLTEEQRIYVASVQDRISSRDKLYKQDVEINWSGIASWLISSYLQLMLFWLLIFIIRFEEKIKAMKMVKRYISELSNYVEYYEEDGSLSLKDELLICPQRLILRVIFWPFYCWHYPHHESPAEKIRFIHLKANYLKYKPVGYQLAKNEEAVLNARAKQRVKDFDQAIHQLFVIETPVLVRKSLITAYLSLFLGGFLQPAIVLAAKHSDKLDKYFYAQVIITQAEIAGFEIDSDHDPPEQNDQTSPNWLIETVTLLQKRVDGLIFRFKITFFFKLKEVFSSIDHIPRRLSGVAVSF